MALKLFFLRHGQTELSRDNLFCGAGMDPDLTEDGHVMAQSFAASFALSRWQAIYTSPLKRARLTVAPLLQATFLEAAARAELREIEFGVWEGKTVLEVERDYHDDYNRWTANPALSAPPGGESAIDISKRVLALIEEIRALHSEGDILLVSHKATIRIALCTLLGIELARFRDRLACPVGSISVVEIGSRGPQLQLIADRSYMEQRLRELPGS